MGWIADLLKEIPSAARYKSELEAMETENASLKSEAAKLRQEIQRRDNVIVTVQVPLAKQLARRITLRHA